MARDDPSTRSESATRSNADVARRLDEVAELLADQDANRYRVQAYRDAATTLRRLGNDVRELYEEGGATSLEDLPNIGESIAGAVAEFLETGSLGLLERLRGDTDPIARLTQVPGIGETLARRAHEQLGIGTLPELERAAHDGSLAEVDGFGERRIEALKDILDARLRRRGRTGPADDEGGADTDEPPVSELLDVDEEYRRSADAGELRTIAPRRFNPEGEAWLPILHTERGDRSYTALYSNTARAHELGTTRDWVVIYVDDTDLQYTVVTGRRGDLEDRRVVRGREGETRAFYQRQAS